MGNRSKVEQRRAPRYPFVANAEIVEMSSGSRMFVQVRELSLYGCYLDMAQPLPSGAHVFIRIFTSTDFLETNACIVHSQPNLGVGLAFRELNPHFFPTLREWLHEAMQDALKLDR
jgi:hypothetical protein